MNLDNVVMVQPTGLDTTPATVIYVRALPAIAEHDGVFDGRWNGSASGLLLIQYD